MRPAIALLLLLWACEAPDGNYKTLKSLADRGKDEQQLSTFKTYPLSERLRLYDKFFRKSGHPRDTWLSRGFTDRPKEAYAAVTSELEKGDFGDFLEYLPILFDLDHSAGFDMCEPQRIDKLRSLLDGYHVNREQRAALAGPAIPSAPEITYFSKCEIVE